MREFYITIDEAFTKGLRPDVAPRNAQYLQEALGVRIGRMGLEGIPFLTNPMPPGVDWHYNWPFPQFLKQESWKILVIRNNVTMADHVYSLDDTYIITHIFDIDTLTFTQGTLMELADFGEYAIMGNGVVMIHWDPTGPGWHAFRDHATLPVMGTVCNFKGQLIGGNITGVWDGVSAFDPWHDCDEKSIIWSEIGSVDCTPDRENTAGYRRDPVGGEIYHVRRLGNDVIVYSSAGVTRMFPVTSPAATFGFEELHDIGLRNKGAMGGNLKKHVFLDIENNFWQITVGGALSAVKGGTITTRSGLTSLGYQEYGNELKNHTGGSVDHSSVIISYEPDKQDFYISDGTDSFLLSPQGMTNYPFPHSAVWYDDENGQDHCGLPESTDTVVTPITEDTIPDFYPIIVVHDIDMGYRGQKTIFSVEIGSALFINAEVAVDWRVNALVNWERTDFVPFNNEGIASIIISGTEFRIVVRGTFFIGNYTTLDYIIARWKMTDLRGLRGVYAAPPRGQ